MPPLLAFRRCGARIVLGHFCNRCERIYRAEAVACVAGGRAPSGMSGQGQGALPCIGVRGVF